MGVQAELRSKADRRAQEAQEARAEADRRAQESEMARAQADAARRELGDELYVSRLHLVQSAFEADQVGRGLALLDLERPRPGEPDRRGFEWHYWRRRAHGERRAWRPLPAPRRHRALRCARLAQSRWQTGRELRE